MAKTLTEDQVADFQEAFYLIDKDSDGTFVVVVVMTNVTPTDGMWIDWPRLGMITMEELAMVIQSLDERPTKEEIQEMMVEVGPDGNGAIDFAGFLNIMSRKMKDNVTEELREAFKVFDRDQDGYISSIEVIFFFF